MSVCKYHLPKRRREERPPFSGGCQQFWKWPPMGMGWKEERRKENQGRRCDFSLSEPFSHSFPTKGFGVCLIDSPIRKIFRDRHVGFGLYLSSRGVSRKGNIGHCGVSRNTLIQIIAIANEAFEYATVDFPVPLGT